LPLVTFGITTSAGTNDNSDFGYANGSPFPLSVGGKLQSLSVFVGYTPPNAHLRMAVYTYNGSRNPGALIAQTGEVVATPGWNTLTVPGNVQLAPGTYWIMAQTDNIATVYRLVFRLPSTSYEGYGILPYGDFPAKFRSWKKVSRRAFDMYGTVATGS